MAIDNVGRPLRPIPVQSDGRRREQSKRKLPKQTPPQESGKRQGNIDELV